VKEDERMDYEGSMVMISRSYCEGEDWRSLCVVVMILYLTPSCTLS